jgi:cytochrome b involved in lipid metabolism
MATPTQTRISGKVVAQHNSRESCWIIVHGTCECNSESEAVVLVLMTPAGKVYDVTEFLDGNPYRA